MIDGDVLDRLLNAQPVLYSAISSAAEYQRQIFGVQAKQHIVGAKPSYHASAYGKYAKRDMAQLCSSVCFCGWIATGFAGQAVSALQRFIKRDRHKIGSRNTIRTLALHSTFLVPAAMFAYVAVLNERAISCNYMFNSSIDEERPGN